MVMSQINELQGLGPWLCAFRKFSFSIDFEVRCRREHKFARYIIPQIYCNVKMKIVVCTRIFEIFIRYRILNSISMLVFIETLRTI
jgi:hypothetical protein